MGVSCSPATPLFSLQIPGILLGNLPDGLSPQQLPNKIASFNHINVTGTLESN